jgi:hypothetical protein
MARLDLKSVRKHLGASQDWTPDEQPWVAMLAQALGIPIRKVPLYPVILNDRLDAIDQRAPCYILRRHLEQLRTFYRAQFSHVATALEHISESREAHIEGLRCEFAAQPMVQRLYADAISKPYGANRKELNGIVASTPQGLAWHALPAIIAAATLTATRKLCAIEIALWLYSPLRDRALPMGDVAKIMAPFTSHPLARII